MLIENNFLKNFWVQIVLWKKWFLGTQNCIFYFCYFCFLWDLFVCFNHILYLHVNWKNVFFWLFNNSGFKLFCEKNDFLAPKIISFVIIIFVLWDLFAWFNHILYLHVAQLFCFNYSGLNLFCEKIISWPPKIGSFPLIKFKDFIFFFGVKLNKI